MSLKFLFEEELFFFSNETLNPTTNNGTIGENKKSISILTKKTLDKPELKLLEKILTALNLSFADVIINTDQEKQLTEFITTHQPKKLLLFGISPYEVGFTNITMNTYEIIDHDGIKILSAEDFSKYTTAADKKKALWYALQKLFS